MNPKRFFAGLALTLLIQILINLLFLRWILPLRQHTGFIVVSMIVMMLFCITLYAAAQIMVRSTMTTLFIQLVMIAVFLKLALCVALIIGYKKGFHPEDQSFIWSFLMVYITSTVYEVIFLEKTGRQKQNKTS